MAQSTIVDDLTSIGLTKNEAKAYHSLVKLGRSPARAIAEDSGIPRSKVYETLNLLAKRGIIRKVLETNPAEFDPAPVDAAMDHLEEKVKGSASSARRMLRGIQELRGNKTKEFAWADHGTEQVIMGLRATIEGAHEYVKIASASPSLLSHLRGAFSSARGRGVNIELNTTTLGSQEVADLEHYLTIEIAMPTNGILVESFKEVFQTPMEFSDEWQPTRMLIMNVDGQESVGVFLPSDSSTQPWSLHIRSKLVVHIQWQVVRSVIAGVEAILQNKKL